MEPHNDPHRLVWLPLEVFAGRGDDGLIQRFQLAVWPDVAGRNKREWRPAPDSIVVS